MQYSKYNIKKLIIVMLLLLSINAKAQDTTAIKLKETNYEFESQVWMQIGGNSINNSFLYKINAGGFIDQSLKDENLSRMKSNNIIGSTFCTQVKYSQIKSDFFGIRNAGFSIGIDYDDFTELQYDKNVFELIFIGNKNLLGETFTIRDNGYRNTAFSTLNVGLLKQSVNKKHQFGFNIGYVTAWKYSELLLDTVLMSFDLNYESAYIQGGYTIVVGDSTKMGEFGMKANGVSFGFQYKFDSQKGTKIQFNVRNAGKVWFGKNGIKLSKEYKYEGSWYEIPNLIRIEADDKIYRDSIIKEFFHNPAESLNSSYLPLELNLIIEQDFCKKWNAQFQSRYRFSSYYSPYFHLKTVYRWKDYFSFGPSISYGGYSKLNGGIVFQSKFKNGMEFNLGSEYISNYLFPSTTAAGIGGFATFTYKF